MLGGLCMINTLSAENTGMLWNIVIYDEKKNINDNFLFLSKVYPYIFANNDFTNAFIHANNNLQEDLFSTSVKKDYGKFYTKDTEIIDSMIESIDLLSGKILEPSCGTGDFCIRIINKLVKLLENKNLSSEQILMYISENFYANDIDVNATLITEIRIISLLSPLIKSSYIANPNFIMPRLHISNINFVQKNSFDTSFSIVIGNPPFVTMYGKRSRNMTEEKRSYFNTFDFVCNKTGNNKFNISMFFIENGLKTLVNNGQLSFVLDISFLETAYRDIRKYLLENYCIQSLTVGLNNFQDVASGQIILTVKKSAERNSAIVINDTNKGIITSINQNEWIDNKNDYKFFMPFNPIEKEINDKINQFQSLDILFPGKSLRTCCALTGKTEEFIYNANEAFEGLVLPYLEGSKGVRGRFFKPTPSFSIKMDYSLQIKLSDDFKAELAALGVKNKKRVTLGDIDAYKYPKLFIRQSAKEIIATFTSHSYAANNSIYILTTKKEDSSSVNMLKYLCGIINSNLITFYSRINKIIRAENGQTPQIKISDLKKIRICVDDKYFIKIINLVDALLINPMDEQCLSELNQIVYTIYGITKTERDYIESYISM